MGLLDQSLRFVLLFGALDTSQLKTKSTKAKEL